MKKYLSLLFVTLILLVFFVSCSTSQNGNNANSSDSGVAQDSTNQSETNIDSSTTDSSQANKTCEHIWVQNDADQCEHLEVCVLCGEERGEDVLHVYFDESGNSLEKCLNCGKQNAQYTPTKETNIVTWQFNYTYWHETETATGEPSATLLVNDGFLGSGFNEIVIPEDLTAGDTITIEYTGYIEIAESFPARIYLQDGEVISYYFSYSNVVPMYTEYVTEELLLEYDAPNNYVILDRSGKYTTLDKYESETVYLVEDQRTIKQRTEDQPFYVACMLAYNPRDLEDGVPNSDNSTENMVFTKNENGNLVNSKGVEYEFLAGEGFLNYLGELEFVGSIEGEEKFSQHLDYIYQTGMFAIKEAKNDNLLIRKMPNNEWFSIYRKTSLPKLDYSLENCVRLEFINETYDTSVSHTTCGDGITDKSEILSFIEEIRTQKSPQEASLYDLVKQPNGMFENCYVCGAIYAFFGEEPNLVVIMQIISYNDLAYSISLDNGSYVLPTEWFTAFQNQ